LDEFLRHTLFGVFQHYRSEAEIQTLRHYRKAPATAIAAAPERPGERKCNVSEIRKLISRWHRDELGAERKAARRKCSKALAPILDIIRKYAVRASLKAVDASREYPA
jgi:hypothetical protein